MKINGFLKYYYDIIQDVSNLLLLLFDWLRLQLLLLVPPSYLVLFLNHICFGSHSDISTMTEPVLLIDKVTTR